MAAKGALAYCQTQLGKPYDYGGDNPQNGFDCSGLVQYAYGTVGISIPRTTYQQWPHGAGAKVPDGIRNLGLSALRPAP